MNTPFNRTFSDIGTEQIDDMAKINELANELYKFIDGCGEKYQKGAREIAIAKTNLEQAAMWARKGISN